jgi:hypothetical protein
MMGTMFAALTAVCCVLALALTMTGIGKLAGHSATIEGLTRVGLSAKFAPALASAELAGAVGLLVGLRWWPIGVAAACGVVLYFLGAAGAHLRSRQGSAAPAAALLAFAVGALTLRLVTV